MTDRPDKGVNQSAPDLSALHNPLRVDPGWLGLVVLEARAQGSGAARADTKLRHHVVTTDEPQVRGGTDTGPTPTETFVAALSGVTKVILDRLATRDEVSVSDVRIEIAATLDRRGVWLSAPIGNPWTRVETDVTLHADVDDATLALWRDDLIAFSPLHALLAAAGCDVSVRLTLAEP